MAICAKAHVVDANSVDFISGEYNTKQLRSNWALNFNSKIHSNQMIDPHAILAIATLRFHKITSYMKNKLAIRLNIANLLSKLHDLIFAQQRFFAFQDLFQFKKG